MTLTKEQIEREFSSALAQYNTIDLNKREKFGSLVQGFYCIKKDDTCVIYPFQFYDKRSLDIVIETLHKLEVDQIGISLVQNYIHYSTLS